MIGGFLFYALVYLAAAVICVPLAKRLGMGSVLGYLFAGILIGPFVFGFIGKEGEDIMHFAEFGVVMMLFLVGLELEPSKFRNLRKMILSAGISQLISTTILFFIVALLLGFNWEAALAIGMALAMSSTAIVLQTLKEQGRMETPAGRNSFAILLFQDVSVIPILALLPLLAVPGIAANGVTNNTYIAGLPPLMKTIVVSLAIGFVILAGQVIIVPLLRLVAKTRLRELFTASSLLIIIGISFLMEVVGLSPALGAFLAGVVLANSEFKHELETDIEPFKGLLLGLFFIAVGASINFQLILSKPLLIVSYTLGLVGLKAGILFLLGKFYKLPTSENIAFSIGLSQVGEFAFVLFAFISQLQILSREQADIMMVITALSMTITPFLFLLNEKIIQPKFFKSKHLEKEQDKIADKHKVILVGFSHFGSTIGRFLRANGVDATILDNDPDTVELLRKMGFNVYYGDATRLDLLYSAGADTADLLITTIDSPETNYFLIETLQKHFPALEIMVRAKNRFDAYKLIDMGVKNIYRENLDTSVRLGVDALRKLGFKAYSAYRSGQNFLRYDEEALWELAPEYHDKKNYIQAAREKIAMQEQLLNKDKNENTTSGDHAWDSEHMREVITSNKK
jgi:monovalent cation:H+ antiporter-2, CPA2 family